MNKGIDALCEAAAGWLGRRYCAAARDRSRRMKSWCSTARARGCFSPPSRPRAGSVADAARPAMLIPNPFYAAYAAGATRGRIASRSICRRPRPRGFLPDLDALSDELLARTVALYHRLAREPAGRGRRPRLSRAHRRAGAPVRISGVQRRMLFRDLHQARARRHARSGGARFRQRGRVPVAVQALEPAGPAHRLCRRRPTDSWRAFWSCATSPRRKCRCRPSGSPSPPTATKRMSKRTGGSTRRNSISPTRSSATATAIGDRPAVFSCGSTCRRRAATRPLTLRLWREARPARHSGPLSRARPGRRLQSRPRLHSRRHGAGPRNHGRGAASPRRGAGLRGSMPAIDRGLDRLTFLPEALRDALRRRLRELGGLALILVAPCSRSRSRPGRCRTLRSAMPPMRRCATCSGVPGAIVADLLMQLLGLAALALVLPIAIWGWRLAHPSAAAARAHARCCSGSSRVLLAAAFAAACRAAPAWPLPVGLGGVVGDAMLRVARPGLPAARCPAWRRDAGGRDR